MLPQKDKITISVINSTSSTSTQHSLNAGLCVLVQGETPDLSRLYISGYIGCHVLSSSIRSFYLLVNVSVDSVLNQLTDIFN